MIRAYRRNRATFGIRNYIVAVPTVACVNPIIERIARLDRSIVPVTHQHGCNHVPADTQRVTRVLAGICGSPNVAGVILVGLGCENIDIERVESLMDGAGKPVCTVMVQKAGGIEKVLARVRTWLERTKERIAGLERKPVEMSGLVVGLECGGSDPFSGITANPAVGMVSDRLVQSGATVILSEVPEMIGAQSALERRISEASVAGRLFECIDSYVAASQRFGCDLLGVNPTPGNIKAGISTIEEKSLGCVAKAGTSEIREFIEYGVRPKQKGLVVMDTPGNDPESLTGMAAASAHVTLFTTGLGTPLGCPVMPVIKIASNSGTYKRMADFTDIDAGSVLNSESVESVAGRIFELLLKVCNGRKTASEHFNCAQIAINRLGPTF